MTHGLPQASILCISFFPSFSLLLFKVVGDIMDITCMLVIGSAM